MTIKQRARFELPARHAFWRGIHYVDFIRYMRWRDSILMLSLLSYLYKIRPAKSMAVRGFRRPFLVTLLDEQKSNNK